jgi:hypothetical protein
MHSARKGRGQICYRYIYKKSVQEWCAGQKKILPFCGRMQKEGPGFYFYL